MQFTFMDRPDWELIVFQGHEITIIMGKNGHVLTVLYDLM